MVAEIEEIRSVLLLSSPLLYSDDPERRRLRPLCLLSGSRWLREEPSGTAPLDEAMLDDIVETEVDNELIPSG